MPEQKLLFYFGAKLLQQSEPAAALRLNGLDLEAFLLRVEHGVVAIRCQLILPLRRRPDIDVLLAG
ncbi:hypothetical protein D3C71_2165750 [compost metagenome]